MSIIQKACANLGLKEPPCPIYFTSKNLRFYEAAAFFQEGKKAWIEISNNKWLRWLGYDEENILTHEFIHALRKDFDDSIYEEMIAYHYSSRSYQRFLGPALSEKGMLRGLVLFSFFPLLEPSLAVLAVLPFILGMIGYAKIYFGFKNAIENLKKKNSNYTFDLLKISKCQIEVLAKKSSSCIRDF